MIYTVEPYAIADFIREQRQTLTEKNSWHAQETAKLLYVYAHHQPSLGCKALDKLSILFSTQTDSRLALQKLAGRQAGLVIAALFSPY